MNRFRRRAADQASDGGFSLIELLVVMAILPMIIGAVAFATIDILQQTSSTDAAGTSARLIDSHDSQQTSLYFVRDVQSATEAVTSPAPVCGSGTQLIGLSLGSSTDKVSYSVQAVGGAQELKRSYCTGSATPSVTPVAEHVFTPASGQAPPSPGVCASANSSYGYGCAHPATSNGFASVTLTCGSAQCSPATTDFVVTTANVSVITLTVQENLSGYQYTLAGHPKILGGGGTPPPSTVPPFLALGTLSLPGSCTLDTSGVTAIDNSSGTSPLVSLGGGNSYIHATGLYTTDVSDPAGAVSGGTNYPHPALAGAPVADPYAGLTPPPTSGPATWQGFPIQYETTFWNPTGTLASGVYVVEAGAKLGSNQLGLQGSVLIYVTGGTVTTSGNTVVALSSLSSSSSTAPSAPYWENPPTTPAPPNLPEPVIWVAGSNPANTPLSSPVLRLDGTSGAVTISGAIYVPSGAIEVKGGGGSGGVNTQQIDAYNVGCDGGGSTTDYIVGSPLVSGTFEQPAASTVSIGQPAKEKVTVTGVGALTPGGSLDVWVCGPTATSCQPCPQTDAGCTTASPGYTPGATYIGRTSWTSPGNGGSTITETPAAYTPTLPGTYCFAAYYSGDLNYNSSADITSDGCFTVTRPTVTITYPTPTPGTCYNSPTNLAACTPTNTWTGTLAGTATDTSPGLQSVKIAVQDVTTGKWWDGAADYQFNGNSPAYVAATGTGSWTYALPATAFPTADTYRVTAVAYDSSGVASLTGSQSFVWGG